MRPLIICTRRASLLSWLDKSLSHAGCFSEACNMLKQLALVMIYGLESHIFSGRVEDSLLFNH